MVIEKFWLIFGWFCVLESQSRNVMNLLLCTPQCCCLRKFFDSPFKIKTLGARATFPGAPIKRKSKTLLNVSNFQHTTTSALIGWSINFKLSFIQLYGTNSSIVKSQVTFKGQSPFFCTIAFYFLVFQEQNPVSKPSFNYFTRMTISIAS